MFEGKKQKQKNNPVIYIIHAICIIYCLKYV